MTLMPVPNLAVPVMVDQDVWQMQAIHATGSIK